MLKICKICRVSKPLIDYTSYKNYPGKLKFICKECESKKIKEQREKKQKELIRLNEENEEIIREFNKLKSANQILKLLIEEYDISWNGKDIITFCKDKKIVHAKHATKDIYNLIFARYCLELERILKTKSNKN